MDPRDAFTIEFYRQSWETRRHEYKLFLNLISVYAVLFGAGLVFMTQSERISDNSAAGIFAFFAILGLIALAVWLQVVRSAVHWAKVQIQIHENMSIQFAESLNIYYRPDWRISWIGILVFLILTLGSAVFASLLFTDVYSPFESTDDPVSVVQVNEPAQITPAQSSEPPWYETGCLTTFPPAFCDSLKDAETAEPSEISTDLTAIIAQNNSLIWSDVPGRSRVLAVTWTDWDGYDSSVGDEFTTTREIWVTIVPQARDFCQNYRGGENLSLRMEQLMGLAPDSGKTKFIELWAFPEDMFRPSPDPAITDREAELDFPKSGRYVSVSQQHVNWINSLRNTSYEEGGLPWTRLGYTYDWGNPDSDVGLSEFVIRAQASIGVRSVTSNDDYC